MATQLAAIDCGTTMVKAAIVDLRGRFRSLGRSPVACRRGRDGSVRQDASAIATAAFACLRQAVRARRSRPGDVAAVVVTNQRATVVCAGRKGDPLAPAFVWQDLRGGPQMARLGRRIAGAEFYRITGLPPHPVFSIGKILWIREHQPDLFKKTARFVLVHDLVARELGASDFFCDHSNASLTGLLDVRQRRWSDRLLNLTGMTAARLPVLVGPGVRIGAVSRPAAARTGLVEGTPIISGGGDQQCAGMGAGCVEAGVCSITLGTAGVCFSAVDRPVWDPARGVTCCVHAAPGLWNVEGLQHAAGDSLRWLQSVFRGKPGAPDSLAAAAAKVGPGADGLIFLPYLAGSGAPDWLANASGMVLGLRRTHAKPALARAVLESVAMENRRIIERFESMGVPVRTLRIGGGNSRLRLWDQIHADVCSRPIHLLSEPESALLGAAMLGALGAGAVPSLARAARDMVRLGPCAMPHKARKKTCEKFYRRYLRVLDTIKECGLFAQLED